MRKREQDPEGFPKAMLVSALTQDGLGAAWDEMRALSDWRRKAGYFAHHRAAQARYWFEQEVRQGLLEGLQNNEVRAAMVQAGSAVEQGDLTPESAAQGILKTLLDRVDSQD